MRVDLNCFCVCVCVLKVKDAELYLRCLLKLLTENLCKMKFSTYM